MPIYDVPLILHTSRRGSVQIEAPSQEEARRVAAAGIGTDLVYAPDIDWAEDDWDYIEVGEVEP